MNSRSQGGNVLFLILIAVILFAALSYAITNSSRNSDQATDEQLAARLARIQNVTASLNAAITRVRAKGCSETEISFEHPNFLGSNGYNSPINSYSNPNSPINGECSIFSPNGGQAIVPEPLSSKEAGGTGSGTGTAFRINTDINFPTTPSSNSELFMYVYVSRKFCTYINKTVGISGIPLNNTVINSFQFLGNFSDPGTNLGQSNFGSTGKKYICIDNYSSTLYVEVLIER